MCPYHPFSIDPLPTIYSATAPYCLPLHYLQHRLPPAFLCTFCALVVPSALPSLFVNHPSFIVALSTRMFVSNATVYYACTSISLLPFVLPTTAYKPQALISIPYRCKADKGQLVQLTPFGVSPTSWHNLFLRAFSAVLLEPTPSMPRPLLVNVWKPAIPANVLTFSHFFDFLAHSPRKSLSLAPEHWASTGSAQYVKCLFFFSREKQRFFGRNFTPDTHISTF